MLNLPSDASKFQIKQAYLMLAQKLHPDVARDVPDATNRFSEVNVAYEILKDHATRWKYDSGQINSNGQEREVDPIDTVMETLWRQMMWEQQGSSFASGSYRS